MSVETPPAAATPAASTPSPSKVDWAAVPRPFKLAWLLIAAAAALLGSLLWPVWASKPELADRFLIPVASVWLVWRAVPALRGTPSRPARWGLMLLVPAAAAFAVGWFLQARVGPRPMLLYWITTAFLATVLGLAVVQLGWGRSRALVFPLLFCLFSLPVPGRLQPAMNSTLQEATTSGAAAILPRLGIATGRQGFVLRLPHGDLGVAEACSGVRSVSALTAIAVLVAYLRGFRWFRGPVLVLATVGIVVVSNTVRVVVTGVLQEMFGRGAVEGWAHEALGILVILVGLALIVFVSGLMVGKRAVPGPSVEPVALPRARGGVAAAGILLVAGMGCAWAEQFRVSYHADQLPKLDRLSRDYRGWHGEDLAVPDGVNEMLMCDHIVCRTYSDSLGRQVQVWVLFWANPASTANAHNPDICWPSRGWTLEKLEVKAVPLADGSGSLPVTRRRFRQGRQQQMLMYWSQKGTHVLTDASEADELFSYSAWVNALLRGGGPWEKSACFAVLVGTDYSGAPEPTERILQDFCGELAADLYRICPWAKPKDDALPGV